MKLQVLPFKTTLLNAVPVLGDSITEREGAAVVLSQGHHFGLSEISPIASLSKVDLPHALNQVEQYEQGHLRFRALSNSAKWAIKMAGLDFRIQSQQLAFRVNGFISLKDGQDAIRKALEYENQGFRVAKVKISPKDIEYQADVINELLNQTERLKLRLDANQSLNREQANRILKNQLTGRIDYFEEPLAVDQEHFQNLTALSIAHGVPIALDESFLEEPLFRSLAVWISRLRLPWTFVIKPQLWGQPSRVKRAIFYAKATGARITFTSMFEGPFGTWSNALTLSQIQKSYFANVLNDDHGLLPTETKLFSSSWFTQTGPIIKIRREDLVGLLQRVSK